VYFAVFLGWVGRRVTPAHRRDRHAPVVTR
jgi:hypothetical protein